MDFWSYVSSDKCFEPDEDISATNLTAIGKPSWTMGSELKPPSSYGSSSMMALNQEDADENLGFMELGLPEATREPWHNNGQIEEILIGKFGPSVPNSFTTGEESSSRLSGSMADSNSRDLSLIDLKLGSFGGERQVQNLHPTISAPNSSSAESFMRTKRLRATGMSPQAQTPFCQVLGCGKDLSSSKDYHKKHKVCEVHSKTAKVTVRGVEQRFCQQCSRFHLLAEFDEGKRSCRKRLATHNERRRKPQSLQVGRTRSLFSTYDDSLGFRYQGTTSTTSSFICEEILPSSLLQTQKWEASDSYKHKKLENGADCTPRSAIPTSYENLHPKSMFHYGIEQFPLFQDDGIHNATGGDIRENTISFPPFCNSSPISTNSWGTYNQSREHTTDFPLPKSASTIQALPEISDSSGALSLLSSRSQNSSSHSSGVPMTQPWMTSRSHSNYSASQVRENLPGLSPQVSTSGVSKKFHKSLLNSVEHNHWGPDLSSTDGHALNFGTNNGVFEGSRFINSNEGVNKPTIDLLHLSSQLQLVERQRYSMQRKQDK